MRTKILDIETDDIVNIDDVSLFRRNIQVRIISRLVQLLSTEPDVDLIQVCMEGMVLFTLIERSMDKSLLCEIDDGHYPIGTLKLLTKKISVVYNPNISSYDNGIEYKMILRYMDGTECLLHINRDIQRARDELIDIIDSE